MGGALLVAGLLMAMAALDWVPAGGDLLALSGRLVLAVVICTASMMLQSAAIERRRGRV
jgi:hypothetical protein